jgi:5-oxoprolinase (ATP-hydrolysing) subunit C
MPSGVDSNLSRAGRQIGTGDVLHHGESTPTGITERLASAPASLDGGPFRLVPGPQPIVNLAGAELAVSNDSDRTGIRLDGMPALELEEMRSEPGCFGAIQATPSGQYIMFGPDGPTIAGYPKVAVVCSADLDRIAHLRPGQAVKFEAIDQETARELMREREARIARTLAQVQIARTL